MPKRLSFPSVSLLLLLLLSLSWAYASPFVERGPNLIVLPSPDKKIIKDLPIIAYRGLPVLGAHPLQPKTLKFKKQHLAAFRIEAARNFADLMRMKLATPPPDKKRLKENFNGKEQHMLNAGLSGAVLEDRKWYALISRLASTTMTDEAYEKYMCKEKPCTAVDLKGKNKGFTQMWGGFGANQFAARRAFSSFVDTELDKYLSWAKTIPAEPEAYFVGKLYLSPYLFDKGGFVVHVKPVSGGLLPTTGENLRTHPVFIARTGKLPGVLVKVDEARAEKMVEHVRGKQLYYVYRAKLTVAGQSYNPKTKQLNFSRLLFDQTITSDTIEVFTDPELKDKLFDIPL